MATMRLRARVMLSAIVMFLMVGTAYADSKLSFRLTGGGTYISGGDVNPGTKAFFDPGTWLASSGGYRSLHSGYEIGGDIIFAFTPRLGLGIGGGYVQISRYSQMGLSPDSPSFVHGLVSSDTKLSAIPIRAGVFLTLPLRGKFDILADLGLSYYFKSSFGNESMRLFLSDGTMYSFLVITTRAEKKGFPVGVHAGVCLEYKLGQNYSFFLGAQARYARFRGWTGRSVLLDNSDPPLSEYEGGTLYYEDVPELAGAPRLLMVQESPPPGPEGEPRQAVIDFSGVSLQLGIRIRL